MSLMNTHHKCKGESYRLSNSELRQKALGMDWTGGARKRYAAGTKNTLLQRQKAHFARVRAQLYNTPGSQRSFRPNYRHKDGSQRQATTPREQTGTGNSRGRSRSTSYHASRAAPHRSPAPNDGSQQPAGTRQSRPRNTESAESQRGGHRLGDVEDEEQRILAERRRLLARSDWLGLSLVRPLAMKFTSAHDKGHVGKRRKLSIKSHSRGAQPRLLTPLFEERLPRPQYFMSGALPADEITVRIGADALASQTPASTRSKIPVNTSLRPLSSESEPLSEESMLLGDDGDYVDVFGAARPGNNDLDPVEDYNSTKQTHRSDSRISHNSGETILPYQQAASRSDAQEVSILQTEPCRAHGSIKSGITNISPSPSTPLADPMIGGRDRFSVKNAAIDHTLEPVQTRAAKSLDSEADEDAVWKRLLNTHSAASSYASVAALRSSSKHLTSSRSARHGILRQSPSSVIGEDDGQPTVSTPNGAGTQQVPSIPCPEELSSSLKSPLASLIRIDELARASPPAQRPAELDSDENALWRQFVFGSQDSDNDSSTSEALAAVSQPNGGGRDSVMAHPSSQSNDISGLGTSISATAGDASFLSDRFPPNSPKPKQRIRGNNWADRVEKNDPPCTPHLDSYDHFRETDYQRAARSRYRGPPRQRRSNEMTRTTLHGNWLRCPMTGKASKQHLRIGS